MSTTPSIADGALYTSAGMVPLTAAQQPDMPGAGWLQVTGGDRVRWLNGMVTNSVQALTTGEGAYCFLLSAQGRIQGDVTVWAENDRLLMQTSSAQVAPLLALLDRFIIMDDVELADISADSQGLLVAGPGASDALQGIGIALARPSRLLKRQPFAWDGQACVLITAYSPLVPRFEVWTQSGECLAAISRALLEAGVRACTEEDLEILRIAEGTPRFGVDIRERELAQETGQTRALHFNKGCYLGQEIVERIRSRGNVHRTFSQFALVGQHPPAGTGLFAEGKQVGELTSVAGQPIAGETRALGFIRREALDRGVPLTFEGGQAEPRRNSAAS